MFKILSPESDQDFQSYYDLRWRILRAPWDQPRGSEKDEHEATAHHICVKSDSEQVIGVGRLHTVSPGIAQIRYMAINENFRQQGLGRQIYIYLEDIARKEGVRKIIVDARSNSVGFYQGMGFNVTGYGHILFNQIEHQVMEKTIT